MSGDELAALGVGAPTEPERWIICGGSGSGKTRFARALAQRWPSGIVFEPFSSSGDPWWENERAVGSRRDYLRAVLDGAPRIRVESESADEWPTGRAAGSLWAGVRDRVVIVDEAHHYAPHQQDPPAMRELLRRGRHRGLSVVLVTQRPADLPPGAWTSATHAAIFRMRHRADVDACRRNLGLGSDWSPDWPPVPGAPAAASAPLLWTVSTGLLGSRRDPLAERDGNDIDGIGRSE